MKINLIILINLIDLRKSQKPTWEIMKLGFI